MPAAEPMLEISGLGKRFGERMAVQDVSFQVPRGSLYGLLGHNGAGKSTTIGAVLGQIHPDAGILRVAGHDVFRSRQQALARVGAIFETPCFYEYLSGRRNLEIFTAYSAICPPSALDAIIAKVGLIGRIDDPVGKYSHGMRQRLALAQALLPDPDFLILDEPGDGLDPEGIAEMREMVLRLNREEGMTILLCSHQLDEVRRLCRELAILRQGRLVFAGDWRALGHVAGQVDIRTDRTTVSLSLLVEKNMLAQAPGGHVLVQGVSLADCARVLVEAGHHLEHLGEKEADLEDFYLRQIHGRKEGA
ncbi:MAG: ABC transporter ATP-binding protein [Candidatus Methylacidiphilales bacterium]|nr:ABC transporter ATP-binding protein [Candidatus Methylacidiphilales bacterium]